MKTILLLTAILTVNLAQAYDTNYVYKFSCNERAFFGVPLAEPARGATLTFIPATANGTFCTVFAKSRQSISDSSIACMGLRSEKTELLVSNCAIGESL